MYLKIGDIPGESTDPAHIDEIEVLGWSWGLSQPISLTTIPAGGSAAFNDLSVTKYIDKSTPLLMKAASTGERHDTAKLSIRNIGTRPVEFYTVEMEGVYIYGLMTGGAAIEDRLTESTTLAFERITVTYIQILPTGPEGDTVNYFWDIPENTGGSGGGGSTTPTDTDNDGIPDSEDPDDDNDGMPDSYELLYGFKTLVDDADLDQDGDTLTNLEEFYVGTDPTKKDSVFKATIEYESGAATATLSWPSVSNLQYRVMSAEGMTNSFISMGTYDSEGDGTTSIEIAPDAVRRFFRIEALVPGEIDAPN